MFALVLLQEPSCPAALHSPPLTLLPQVHLTQAFWAVPTASVQRVDYEHKNKEPSDVMLNIAPADEPSVRVRGMLQHGGRREVGGHLRFLMPMPTSSRAFRRSLTRCSAH